MLRAAGLLKKNNQYLVEKNAVTRLGQKKGTKTKTSHKPKAVGLLLMRSHCLKTGMTLPFSGQNCKFVKIPVSSFDFLKRPYCQKNKTKTINKTDCYYIKHVHLPPVFPDINS